MALLASAKFQNFKVSIEKFLFDNLTITEGIPLDLEGMPFESSIAEWIEERLLSQGVRDYHRGVTEVHNAQTTMPIVNLNIFVKKNLAKKSNRHYELRDIIASYITPNKRILLYDFESGDFTTSIQTMVIREIITDMPIQDELFFQYNYSFTIEWYQQWEK